MARLLATGDHHLGAGPDLGLAPGDRLAEQEDVWRRTLEIARESECDVVLSAGDIFDRVRPTPQEIIAVERPLLQHRALGGCPVWGVVGNHEVSGTNPAHLPEAFTLAGLWDVRSMPSVLGAVGGVTVCALPWASVSRIVAAAGGGDRDDVNAYASELLMQTARVLRDGVDGPAVLVTHFSISGSSLPNGLPVDQLREPVLELAELEALGFEAVIAGHIHVASVFGDGVFYVGSPMPLSFGEAGYDHGCFILEPDTLSGAYVARFVPIASRPLRKVVLDALELEVPAGGGPNFIDWEEHDVSGAIVKVAIHATRKQAKALDLAALKREVYAQGAHKVYAVNLEVEREERARVEGLTEEIDEMEALRMWCASVGINGPREAALVERHERYRGLVRA